MAGFMRMVLLDVRVAHGRQTPGATKSLTNEDARHSTGACAISVGGGDIWVAIVNCKFPILSRLAYIDMYLTIPLASRGPMYASMFPRLKTISVLCTSTSES